MLGESIEQKLSGTFSIIYTYNAYLYGPYAFLLPFNWFLRNLLYKDFWVRRVLCRHIYCAQSWDRLYFVTEIARVLYITIIRCHIYHQSWIESNTNGDILVRVFQGVLIQLPVASQSVTFNVKSIMLSKRQATGLKYEWKRHHQLQGQTSNGKQDWNRWSRRRSSPFVWNSKFRRTLYADWR